jgi:hypothetical protein
MPQKIQITTAGAAVIRVWSFGFGGSFKERLRGAFDVGCGIRRADCSSQFRVRVVELPNRSKAQLFLD